MKYLGIILSSYGDVEREVKVQKADNIAEYLNNKQMEKHAHKSGNKIENIYSSDKTNIDICS